MSHAARLPKVVQIGFNRCGTRSLARLFEAAGYQALHHKIRRPLRRSRNGARRMRDNLAAGRRVFSGMENYTFYSDLIYLTESELFEGYLHFREIIRDYPDTIFILNLRDREAWIRSRLRHGHGEFARRAMLQAQLDDADALAALWRRAWDEHIADVRSFMAAHPGQLIEFNLDSDDVGVITEALSRYGLDPQSWGDTGNTRQRRLGRLSAFVKRYWAHIRPRRHA
jgi:hypothetical protein